MTYDKQYLVGIRVVTYNQVEYLSEALESIVRQKTDFRFFALVHDDASTDGTTEVLRQYAERYPDIIFPMYEEENQFSQHNDSMGWKIDDAIFKYGVKYVAILDGDDYWCDDYKLQKQVDFLESHPDYAVCAHETQIVDQSKYKFFEGELFSELNGNLFIPSNLNDYTFEDTLTGNIFHWSSFMYRMYPNMKFPDWLHKVPAADMVYYRYMGWLGKTHRFDDIMSVYRFHPKSMTSEGTDFAYATKFNDMNIQVLRLLNRYWNRQYQHLIYPIISRYYMRSLFVCWSKSGRDYALARKMAKKAWLYDKWTFMKYFWIESYRKLKKHL